MKLFALVLASMPVLAFAEDADTFTCAEHGFRISRPGATWAMAEVPATQGTVYGMKISRLAGGTETSVSVYVCERQGLADEAAACDASERLHRSDPKSSGLKRGTAKVAGEERPTLTYRYDLNGTPYTVRQHILLHHDRFFLVQFVAPAETFEATKEFAPMLDAFEFIALKDPKALERDAALRKLAARCGSEVDWAGDWPSAAARAKKERKAVMIVVEQYSGLAVETYSDSTLMMDPDIVALVNARFIPWHWRRGTGAPFEDPDNYGLGPWTFGGGVLFANADGDILGEAPTFNPFVVYDRARLVLKQSPGAPPEDPDDADERLQRGDLEEAEALLKDSKTAVMAAQKVELLRLQRKGVEALRAVEFARKMKAKGMDLEEGRIRFRLGELTKAGEIFGKLDDPDAVFWNALCKGWLKGIAPVREDLQELCDEHPENRLAWRAAALLLRDAASAGVDLMPWPAESQVAASLPSKWHGVDDAGRAAGSGLEFLLKSQEKSGAWPVPMWISMTEGEGPVAVAAICGQELLARQGSADVDAALQKAYDFVMRADFPRNSAILFDHAVWCHAYQLRFVAACAEAKYGDRDAELKKMQSLVDELAGDRVEGGGWAYFRRDGAGEASIGFVSAAVLCALADAKHAGAKVPNKLVDRALAALEALRAPSGAFDYMSQGEHQGKDRQAEASLRSPLCALALFRWGKADAAALRSALDVYFEHHKTVRKERGKTLCHTAPEGTASYYILFGLAYGAEAVLELPEADRKHYQDALVDDALTLRTDDGGFCDNAAIGRAYGAGMALRVLRLASPPK